MEWYETPRGMAVYAVCDELEYLRGERAAVVAWLRRQGGRSAWTLTDAIERGEHRREGEP